MWGKLKTGASLISWYHRWWKGSGRLRNSATPQAQRPCLSSSVWCKVEQNSQANIVLQSVIHVAWTLVTKTRESRCPRERREVFLREVHTLYTLYALTIIYFNSEITSIKFTLGHEGTGIPQWDAPILSAGSGPESPALSRLLCVCVVHACLSEFCVILIGALLSKRFGWDVWISPEHAITLRVCVWGRAGITAIDNQIIVTDTGVGNHPRTSCWTAGLWPGGATQCQHTLCV